VSKEEEDYRKLVFESRELHDDSIAYFKTAASELNPNLAGLMYPLIGKVTPKDFVMFCDGFAEGMAYVRKKFGTQPALVSLVNKGDSPNAILETSSIHIPTDFIEAVTRKGHSFNSKASPFLTDIHDTAFTYGVEEAYHIYQMTTDPERCHKLFNEQKTAHSDTSGLYDENPIEKEARDVVRQAMIETGIIHRAQFCNTGIEPKDMTWLGEDFLRARTHPSTTVQPHTKVMQERMSAPQTIIIQA
jgi:hypothetical protein